MASTGDTAPSEAAQRAELERNLSLIPLHQALTGALVWLPVFVLFTRARFDLDGALALASAYYFFVVALEVPSGWMSDRLGRVLTLRVAAVAWIGAHLCFLVGDDTFMVIMLGQFLLAAGFASLSGTDVTFHYDTLESLDRADEYADRQAKVASIVYVSTSVSALVGGLLGLVDVRLAFLASLLLAVAQLGVALRFGEPIATTHAERFGRQVALCFGYLKQRYLGWLFFYGVVTVTLVHVAFTVMQPWLTAVLDRPADDLGSTPLVAGVIYAVTALVGSVAARASAPVARRIGIVPTLIGLGAVSALVVSGMALWVNAVVLVLVSLRSVQGAAAPVLVSAAVSPRVERHHRATLLSLNSLVGRLGYGLVLLFVAAGAEDDVQRVLGTLAAVAWALVAVLGVTAMVFTRGRQTSLQPDPP
ncbi:MAG: MFS transporter [Acidimicrobiales bacterium]